MKRPSAEEIDLLARQYRNMQQDAADLAKAVRDFKEQRLVPLVKEFGEHPPKATKSLRLSGEKFELTISTPTTVRVSRAAVEKLYKTLVKARSAQLFKMLFTREEIYTVAPGARIVVEGGAPPCAPRNLKQLFYAALKIESGKPKLEVAEREAEPKE